MSSARIDLASRGLCASGIDRSMPAIMTPYMDSVRWHVFCDEIDEALAPVNKMAKIGIAFFGATFAIFVIVSILSVVNFTRDFNDPWDSSSGPAGSFAVLFVAPAALMLVSIGFVCFAATKSQQAIEGVQNACVKASAAQPRLSFHVRYQYHYFGGYHPYGHHHHGHHHHGHHHNNVHVTQYIEVSILQDQVTIPIGNLTATTPSSIPSSIEENQSAADRLAQLENIKNLLNPDEYERKRAEIIADL